MVSLVQKKPGILLQDLLDQSDEIGITADDIYSLILGGDLFVDLQKHVLAEPQYTHLFINEETATAYVHIDSETIDNSANTYKSVVLEVGKSILWDGRKWEILTMAIHL